MIFSCVNPMAPQTAAGREGKQQPEESTSRKDHRRSNTPASHDSYYTSFFGRNVHHRQCSSISSLESNEVTAAAKSQYASQSRPNSAMKTRKALATTPMVVEEKKEETPKPPVKDPAKDKSRYHFRTNSNSVIFADEKTPRENDSIKSFGQKAYVVPSEMVVRQKGNDPNSSSSMIIHNAAGLDQGPTLTMTKRNDVNEDNMMIDNDFSHHEFLDGRLPLPSDLLDNVLEEGIKLKKKYKQLKILYHSLEQEKAQEKQFYEQHFQQLLSQYESKINETRTSLFLDYKSKQEALSIQVHSLETDLSFLQQEKNELLLSMQVIQQENVNLSKEKERLLSSPNAQEIARQTIQEKEKEILQLTNQLSELIHSTTEKYNQLEALKQSQEETFLAEQQQWTSEKADLLQRRDALSKEALLYRDRVKELEKENDHLNQEIEGKSRLIDNMKEVLDRQKKEIAKGNQQDHSMAIEREQRLMVELTMAKDQILELQEALENVLSTRELIERNILSVVEENERMTEALQQQHQQQHQHQLNSQQYLHPSFSSSARPQQPPPAVSKDRALEDAQSAAVYEPARSSKLLVPALTSSDSFATSSSTASRVATDPPRSLPTREDQTTSRNEKEAISGSSKEPRKERLKSLIYKFEKNNSSTTGSSYVD